MRLGEGSFRQENSDCWAKLMESKCDLFQIKAVMMYCENQKNVKKQKAEAEGNNNARKTELTGTIKRLCYPVISS